MTTTTDAMAPRRYVAIVDGREVVEFPAVDDAEARAQYPNSPLWRLEIRRLYRLAVAVASRPGGPRWAPSPEGLPRFLLQRGFVASVPEWMLTQERVLDEQEARERIAREAKAAADAREGLSADGMWRLSNAAAHGREQARQLRQSAERALRALGQGDGASPADVAGTVASLLAMASSHEQAAALADEILRRDR